jgi:uncharacterized protein YbjT (DUF2867 family)
MGVVMKIAVAGGTGVAGRYVVEALRARGHEPVVLSRAKGVDLLNGTGLEAALAGAEGVVDVANVTTMRKSVAVEFFDRAGRNLVTAAERAGVRHLVTLSIVGVDRVRNPYYAGKLRQEEIVRGGAVPWTILRATQFHQLLDTWFTAAARLPVLPIPGIPVQPIDAAEVADALVAAVGASTGGRLPDVAGPQLLTLDEAARQWLKVRRPRGRVVTVPLPGRRWAALRSGALTAPDRRIGTTTFADWLGRG